MDFFRNFLIFLARIFLSEKLLVKRSVNESAASIQWPIGLDGTRQWGSELRIGQVTGGVRCCSHRSHPSAQCCPLASHTQNSDSSISQHHTCTRRHLPEILSIWFLKEISWMSAVRSIIRRLLIKTGVSRVSSNYRFVVSLWWNGGRRFPQIFKKILQLPNLSFIQWH